MAALDKRNDTLSKDAGHGPAAKRGAFGFLPLARLALTLSKALMIRVATALQRISEVRRKIFEAIRNTNAGVCVCRRVLSKSWCSFRSGQQFRKRFSPVISDMMRWPTL